MSNGMLIVPIFQHVAVTLITPTLFKRYKCRQTLPTSLVYRLRWAGGHKVWIEQKNKKLKLMIIILHEKQIFFNRNCTCLVNNVSIQISQLLQLTIITTRKNIYLLKFALGQIGIKRFSIHDIGRADRWRAGVEVAPPLFGQTRFIGTSTTYVSPVSLSVADSVCVCNGRTESN